MQTLSKVKNPSGTSAHWHLAPCPRNAMGIPQRVGLSTFALAAALVLTTGCVHNDPATQRPPTQASSEVENPEHTADHKPPPPPHAENEHTGHHAHQKHPPTSHAELENTKRNARDKDNSTLTPEDQKETKSDIQITRLIRQAVVKNKSLSLNAHNAKIITRDGVVTLRGSVKNATEKHQLQAVAEKTRGVKQVDNQLETTTP